MTEPDLTYASTDPKDYPDLSFSSEAPGLFFPPECPPLAPEHVAATEVVITPGDGAPEVPATDEMIVVPVEHLSEAISIEPEES